MTALPGQTSLFDLMDAPAADPHEGQICHCGWLMAAMHIRAVDQPTWQGVRHLWMFVPFNNPAEQIRRAA